MAVSQEVATYFAANGIGTLGTTVFWGVEPTTPANTGPITTVLDSVGLGPEFVLKATEINVDRPGVQVLVRGAQQGYSAAWDKAQAAYKVCAALIHQTLTGVLYLVLTPTSAPRILEFDANDRAVIVFSAWAEKDPS